MRIPSDIIFHGRRLLLAFATVVGVLTASQASAITAYVLTDNQALVVYDTSGTGNARFLGPVSGLQPGEEIQALDVRPLTARLYAVTRTRLYIVDVEGSTPVAIPVSTTAFAEALGGSVGMDFDPVADRIRIVTSVGQNWRIDPQTGAVTVDTSIAPAAAIGAIAFTHNHSAADRATLYGIDDATNRLVRIGGLDAMDGGASQAAGTLTPAAAPLGFTGDTTAFDIMANDHRALAVAKAPADIESTLYLIDLATGAATAQHAIDFNQGVRALAVYSRPTTIYALTSNQALIRFSSVAPDALLGSPLPITGLQAGETIDAIDMRASTGALYGVSNQQRIYVLNTATGQASSPIAIPAGLITSTVLGFDFTAVPEFLEMMSITGEFVRLRMSDGQFEVGPARSIPNIVGLASMHQVPFPFTSVDGNFRTYGIDSAGHFVNFSRLTGVLLAMPAPVTGELTGFDIARADGMGYVSATANGASVSTLYAVDLENGQPLRVGDIGGGATIRGIAAANTSTYRFAASAYSVGENAGTVAIKVLREFGSEGPATVRVDVLTGTNGATSAIVQRTLYAEFADGQTSSTVTLPVLDDQLDDPNEDVLMTMTPPAFATNAGGLVVIRVFDNDSESAGGPPSLLVTTPTRDATYTASGAFVTLAGEATDTLGAVASVTWTNDRGYEGTASIGASADHVDWIANDVPLAPGVNVITVTAFDNDGIQVSKILTITLNELSYFLAEGATGSFFDLDLLLANPHADPVTVAATFLRPGGQGTVVRQYTLSPKSRLTVRVEEIPELESAEVSTIVTAPATHPIVVERTMRWNEAGYGAHTDKAHPGASTRWYFAEGSHGFFSTYLLLANPQAAENFASVTYLRENAPSVTHSYTLQPNERFTVDVGTHDDLVNQSFGMEVTFDAPGIAERAMYFGTSPLWEAGHESMGVTQPSREWFLAEGATGPFFETFVLLANPSATTAVANVRYLLQAGSAISRSYEIPGRQRVTVNIQAEDPALENVAVATEVTSATPIVVERAQYWPDPAPSWYEAHNSFGITSTGRRWGLAEGRVGGPGNYQTYVLLANPHEVDAEVTIELVRESGAPVTKTFTVAALRRVNVLVGGPDVPEITEGNFGAVITSTQPIAVERAMYSDAEGVIWRAGTNAVATRLP